MPQIQCGTKSTSLMHFFLLLLLVQDPILPAAEAQSFDHVEIQFDEHWGAYLLAKHGCLPPDNSVVAKPITKGDCTPARRRVLTKEREKARDLVRKVFPDLFNRN